MRRAASSRKCPRSRRQIKRVDLARPRGRPAGG
jgi:hypothetical protein